MNRPKLIMMCGLPCSGKSYKAQELAIEYNAEIFSSNELRAELFGDINCQDRNHELFIELHRRIKDCLRSGKSAIYDSCAINYKRRMAFLKELTNIPCEKICVLMATPYEVCLKRSAERDRKVPEEVIKRMYTNFNIPYWYENWDDIQIIYSMGSRGKYGYPTHWLETVKGYDQHNSHHALTLGAHCEQAWHYINVNLEMSTVELRIAAILHDCQKPFVAQFKNTRGEDTTECHYYNHQFCSAYDSLFFSYAGNHLDVAIMIMWHMQLYFIKEEKTLNKYKKLWGEELYNNLCLLHEADRAAH